jgi:hypothetical protein
MKQDMDWNNVIISYDPLTLYRLIEMTVLAKTEDQYPSATVYDQELSFYLFKQDNLSSPQWYERFNTNVGVSGAIGVKKLKKNFNSINKACTTVNTQLAQLKEADSDISESEGEEALHFQVDQALQFAQLDKKFKPRIAKIFKQAGSSIKPDLKEVILLDSQSTLDIFCNTALVSKISRSIYRMRQKSNGGIMIVTRKTTMEGYNKTVWFSTRAITNIIALRNLIYQYHVTYDSDDLMFVVHRESESEPSAEYKMHKSGLHYYDLMKEHHLTFVNNVSENKTGFTKRKIKCA